MTPKEIQRFFSKVKVVGSCWEWQASLTKGGYGQFELRNKMVRSHRFSYQLFKEDLNDLLDIDHLCRNRKCVNNF